jgi:hypothetical protein
VRYDHGPTEVADVLGFTTTGVRDAERAEQDTGEAREFPVRVFVSYAHTKKDDKLHGELLKSLAQLRRDELIASWDERGIEPGDDREREVDENLEAADIILLLVSPDFIQYCVDTIELKRARERYDQNGTRVIPVILRPADWESTWFGPIQAIPYHGAILKPVTIWRDRDMAWFVVTKSLRKLVSR